MSIVIFILVLVALIVVHEFGHFVAAKLSGMRVDEFGIGYPPRLWGVKYKGTDYTLNALPFGGFVRIYGEDGEDRDDKRAFSARPRVLQAATLVAGIAMNLVFAWLLISATLALGAPRALSPEEMTIAKDQSLLVANVLPGSPASEAGLLSGDRITLATMGSRNYTTLDPDEFTKFIAGDTGTEEVMLHVRRGGEELTLTALPRAGVVEADPQRLALGVAIVAVGSVPVPMWKAPLEGFVLTWEITKETAIGLAHFFGSFFTFSANLSQVAGPVGIAGAVGTASADGLAALLSITALISINLALINLLPMPALDGGRILFVIIESITRKRIRPSIAGAFNTVGFGLLILLMVVVTAHDIFKIVG